MSGKRAGKPRYRLGVSQGGCGTGSVIRPGSGMEQSLPRESTIVVVEDGNGRPDRVEAMPKQPVASDSGVYRDT